MRTAAVLVLAMVAACAGPSSTAPASPAAARSVAQSPGPSHPANGGVVEYKVPPKLPPAGCVLCGSAVDGMVVGPDRNMWFIDVGTDHLGRVNADGSVVQFAVPGAVGGSMSMTSGPDGNLWMTAQLPLGTDAWILRVTPTGVVTKFSAGSNPTGEGTGPRGITVGPDGNLWFTESVTSRIGRLTPTGGLTEFPTPTGDSAPLGIVSGPDGNLWFTESSTGRFAIGRISVSGAIIEFPLRVDTPNLEPTAIISGPDHNLWFSGLGEIDRMTTGGIVTRFPNVVGQDTPPDLTVGPDGNIWFADKSNNAIGRLQANGTVREFGLSRRYAEPAGIATGRDGRIWFAEPGIDRIGSIGVTVPEVTLSAGVVRFGAGVQTEFVKNTGDGPLQVDSVEVAGPDRAEFGVASDGCSHKTVPVGADCQLTVTHTPGSAAGIQAARLVISDNATGSPQVVSIVAQLPDCQLPVVTWSVSYGPLKPGLLAVRSGDFAADVTADQSSVSYVQSIRRWLPVTANLVSPDGKRYVIAEPGVRASTNLHVVDIATGADRALPTPAGPWSPLAFTREGIYVNIGPEGVATGVSLIDPDTGAMHDVLTSAIVLAVGGGAVWTGDVNAKDPHPSTTALGFAAPDEVLRRDPVTGHSAPWFYAPGVSLSIASIAGGDLLVSGGSNPARWPRFWIVSSPNSAYGMVAADTGDPLQLLGSAAADIHGLWLGSLDGVYLWTARTGPVLVSGTPAAVGGPCA